MSDLIERLGAATATAYRQFIEANDVLVSIRMVVGSIFSAHGARPADIPAALWVNLDSLDGPLALAQLDALHGDFSTLVHSGWQLTLNHREATAAKVAKITTVAAAAERAGKLAARTGDRPIRAA